MDAYQKTVEFHKVFDSVEDKGPHALTKEKGQVRAHFMVEELVEYLGALVNDEASFDRVCEQLKESIDVAREKVLRKEGFGYSLVGQSDALVDLLYFTYGTFVLMNTNPNPLFDIVHRANMGKLFPDGKPHYDAVTGKVLKPDNWERDYAPEAKLAQEIQRQIEKDEYCE